MKLHLKLSSSEGILQRFLIYSSIHGLLVTLLVVATIPFKMLGK